MNKLYQLEELESGRKIDLTLSEILEEINRDRSENWTPYDRRDWREGLEHWTQYRIKD